ncbi:hypothetical protein DFH09DRAFT_1128368 [Mycena vulgaris]|nr:hypothetical protein DFH09DRAFT_1128368 [Mycena vulgaris]
MPFQPALTQIRLSSITEGLNAAAITLDTLSTAFDTPFFEAISSTTRALMISFETVKGSKAICIQWMEQVYELLYAIIRLHLNSGTGGELSPSMLYHIGKFTDWIKHLFRHGEMSALLKECNTGLQQALAIFKVQSIGILADIANMQRNTQMVHEEVLELIETLSDDLSSSRMSSMYRGFLSSQNSSNSLSMLPSEPKIFHGREPEISQILQTFIQETPRIAILGAGGMGKTSLARTVLHHPEVSARYEHGRFFVACDKVSTTIELASLIGSHVGLRPGADLTRPVIHYFLSHQPSLLILDNLETLWEPMDSRREVEEFLSLLTDVDDLALIITMRGMERPTTVRWTHPFLQPLRTLTQDAARKTFIDITDSVSDTQEIDKILLLADNMPLAIDLIAHLVDYEGASSVLSRWETEKTSLLSEGHDRRSNLDLSISLSLSSPRFRALPHSYELLSLLSVLPDGLSDVELLQSALPVNNILGCKAALMQTSLAYTDDHRQLKTLLPIREYVQKHHPPQSLLIHSLLEHFQELLGLYSVYQGTLSSAGTVARITSNFSNIQNILFRGLNQDNPDLIKTIYCICDFDFYSRHTGHGRISLMDEIPKVLPQPRDPGLEVHFITRVFGAWTRHPIPDPEDLITQALEHFNHLNDTDLKCRFYHATGEYHRAHSNNIPAAIEFCQTALTLSITAGNTKRQPELLSALALNKWQIGEYTVAQKYAYEAQRIAKITGDLFREAHALQVESVCWNARGSYKHSISLYKRARQLLGLCGMSGGDMDHNLIMLQAEIHKSKSEYVEAHNILAQLIDEVSIEQNPYVHAFVLLNIAESDVEIGAPKHDVERNLDTAKSVLTTMGFSMGVTCCDTILADLDMREGNLIAAETLFQDCFQRSWGKDIDVVAHCLERLGNTSHWPIGWTSTWTNVFFVHALKSKRKLEIYKAFLFLGEICTKEDDQDTAISLFTVALDGFTQMDVHRSRAECMLGLGNISKLQGDLAQAEELWKKARTLFERSSQAKQVTHIDGILALSPH